MNRLNDSKSLRYQLAVPSGAAVTRRRFCQSLLSGAAMVGPGLLPFTASGKQTLDLGRESDLLQAMIKMRGSLDSELVIGWLRAKRFAVSQGRIEPLCGFIAATFNRFRQVSDELFEVVTLEITHYTDFQTGELLDRLVMPFADREVEVPLYRFGPVTSRFAVHLDEKDDFAPAAGTTEGAFAPAGSVLMTKSIHTEAVRGGKLVMRHEEHGRVKPNDSDIPTMFYKESTIWSAGLSDVLDPSTSNVDASVGYSAMTSWRPWMQMGDLPGHTTSNGFGGKARSMSDLPEDFLRYTQQRHPDVIADPEALLDAFQAKE
jgi:hypothetical protein